MLEDIKGIGPKSLLALKALNLYTKDDVINYFPYRYNVYTPVKLRECSEGDTCTITGYVESIPKVFFIRKNLNKLSFAFNTGSELVNVTIFNRAYLKPNIRIKSYISVIGKYNRKSNTFMASDIKLTPITKTVIEPVYHLNQGIKRSNFKKLVDEILDNTVEIKSNVPDYLIEKYNFINKKEAVTNVHKPKDINSLKKADLHLIYEELFTFMLKVSYLKEKNASDGKFNIKSFDEDKVNNFINSLPFSLTDGQMQAVDDIKGDFLSKKKMNRLILGDVGSGKTIVSFIALYMNMLAGYQGVLMAPTEILAVQHFNNMVGLFGDKLNIQLLTSSTKKGERNKILQNLKNGETQVLIGTHSLLNDELVYNNLGLVITDEQHRFGVNQRQTLQEKGKDVDVLYMSATPIPRTLALTIYGDMDITEIRTKPGGRKEIITKIFKNSELKNVLEKMLDEIKAGHQIYVVAPLIDDEEDEKMNVTSLKDKFDVAFNGMVPTGLLHGKMKPNQKDEVMNSFKNGDTKILISTTVIEVGVDVKNATMMVIFNAERFGLATLHQLRGRVGRNDMQSYCYLISDYDAERLKVLEESNDGFYISEQDFKLRGGGDIFGIRQSGEQSFKIANLNRDYKILMQCKSDAEEFLKSKNLDDYKVQKEILENLTIA
ncbi:MAG: ATP-dependent DNA helicase RecG [Bacilli bacterium]|nr:ATP-dependent DNA helicase RecG [Bacilli bacterium]